MIVYWLLLLPTAFVAYIFGSLDTIVIASNFFFRRNLRKLGTGNRWLSNFRRIFGLPGFIKLAIAEILKDIIPILIGGMLLGIKDHAEVGRAFAGFCLVLGRLYPVFYGFKGSHASIALVVAAFAVDTSAGGAALVILGLVCLTRYLSLATVAEAIVLIMVAVLIIEDALLMRLLIFSALLVIFKHIPAMIRLVQGREFRYSLEEDITYKLDERF